MGQPRQWSDAHLVLCDRITNVVALGIEGLRVVDCSMMPTMVAGNRKEPMMAMAWHTADLIIDGR